MTSIAEKDRPAVRDMLARELVEDVELLLFTRSRSHQFVRGMQDSQSCAETRELLEELVRLSDKLHLTLRDVEAEPAAATLYNVVALPTVIIRRRPGAKESAASDASVRATPAGPGANVRFLGLPGGYEFSTLLADVVDISRDRTDLSAAALEIVRAIDTSVHIQVFVTPT
jgi:alkyl hydroperoxide reductase subunit AhpF